MNHWIEKQRYIIDFTISSLLRRKVKNLGLLVLYTLIVFILASTMFFTYSIKKEASLILKGAPEIVVQKIVAGRHDLLPFSYVETIRKIRGVAAVESRLWGYYYDSLVSANYTVLYAAYYGVQILRHWNIESGDELQLILERKTYLISTVLSYVFGLQLLSLFLFIFTADALCPLFVGAMCAAGTLNVNAFGYPTLVMKMVNFILAGSWLVFNYADNQGYDYPLIKKKYGLLTFVAPLIVIETLLESAYFLDMRADVVTSCCGSLFSAERVEGLGSETASLPARPMLWVFYIAVLCTLASGLFFYVKGKGGYLYAGLSLLMFGIALVAIVSVISLYIYELPTHHCPFCIVMEEYHYIGYLLLFGAVVSGIGSGLLIPFRQVASLKQFLDRFVGKLALISVLLYAAFTALVSYEILTSSMILSYEVVY